MTQSPLRHRLLLIEDNPGDARLIIEILRELPGRPFEAEHAATLADGLQRLEEYDVDLLLLDLGLPDSQGRDTLLKVRNLDPDLPIVVLTGLDDERLAVETLQLGAQDYLIKGDYQVGQLGRSLRYAIERKQVENALREAHFKEEMERQAERERIAMDLHDGVIQDIYGVALSIELALAELENDRDVVGPGLERAMQRLHEILGNIRSYIFELRPRRFSGNLANDLQELAREFEHDSQIKTTLVTSAALPPIADATGLALYHIAHEALSNARKHAHASEVTIRLDGSAETLVLTIRDDGAGFDTGQALPEKHRGLRNMTDRAGSIGAALTVESSPGFGTTIRVESQAHDAQAALGWLKGRAA